MRVPETEVSQIFQVGQAALSGVRVRVFTGKEVLFGTFWRYPDPRLTHKKSDWTLEVHVAHMQEIVMPNEGESRPYDELGRCLQCRLLRGVSFVGFGFFSRPRPLPRAY